MPTFKSISRSRKRTSAQTSFMAPKGMNTRAFSQIMDINQSVLIRNYIPRGPAELEKRRGRTLLADNSVDSGVTLYESFTDTIHIVGYGTSIYAVDITTGTWTPIKTDFSSNQKFEGLKAGDYFFAVNGVDRLTRIYRQVTGSTDVYVNTVGVANEIVIAVNSGTFSNGDTLTFSGGGTATISTVSLVGSTATIICVADNTTAVTLPQTVIGSGPGTGTVTAINQLSVGDRITGQTSGFKATVLEASSGVFVLGNIIGTPQNGETVLNTDSPAGRSVLSSGLTWNTAFVSGAPIAKTIGLIGGRLYLGNLLDDPTATAYSALHTGTNPPFTDWTVGSGVNAAGRWIYPEAGDVNSITNYGNIAVIFHENGYTAFYITQLDVGGTLSKVDTFADAKIDEGGERGAINTSKGILSVSENGFSQLLSIGQTDVPFSQQKVDITNDLSDAYFEGVDFSNTDIVFDNYGEFAYVTIAKDSAVNNLIIGYAFKSQALFEIDGWSISRFVFTNGILYGADAQSAKIYKLFDGGDDLGEPISCEYIQELPVGLVSRNNLYGMYFQGLLSDGSEINIDLDIYQRTGVFVPSYQSWLWTASNLGSGSGSGNGYNRAYSSPYGGSSLDSGLINSFDGFNARLHNFQRIFVKVSSSDLLPHSLNYMYAETKPVANIRTRKITKQ